MFEGRHTNKVSLKLCKPSHDDDFTFQLEPSENVTPNSVQRVGHQSRIRIAPISLELKPDVFLDEGCHIRKFSELSNIGQTDPF
jgi:hypothetical protein